jgi:release factor glutamine methyltransferase
VSATAVPVAFENSLVRRAWRSVLRLKLALIDRRKYERTVLEEVDGLTLVVPPDVFNPKLLRSGAFLVEQARRLPPGLGVLDLGCGSGASGIAAARAGCRVTASDINPAAVRCTRANALLNNVEVEVQAGDLFAPLGDARFDVVLFNPPYYRGVPRHALDHAWRSPDVIERFAEQLDEHLTPNGYALVVLSSDGAPEAFLSALQRNGFGRAAVAQRDFLNEVMTVYRVDRC